MADWLLYEHDDGRHAVAPSAEAATFAHGDPAWHRVGPVEAPASTTGSAVVPTEPTQAMLEAGAMRVAMNQQYVGTAEAKAGMVWRDMVAASAPASGGSAVVPAGEEQAAKAGPLSCPTCGASSQCDAENLCCGEDCPIPDTGDNFDAGLRAYYAELRRAGGDRG